MRNKTVASRLGYNICEIPSQEQDQIEPNKSSKKRQTSSDASASSSQQQEQSSELGSRLLRIPPGTSWSSYFGVEDAMLGRGTGVQDVLRGIHLYRCWNCKVALLKPLQCGSCLTAAYCSKVV